MSDIKVGDLVWIKPRPCCGNGDLTGSVMKVERLWGPHDDWCSFCGVQRTLHYGSSGEQNIDIRRLRRIPPVSELESSEDKEETPA